MSSQPAYIDPEGAPVPLGMYSNLSRVGPWMFVAGQVGLDTKGELAGGSLESQAPKVFENIGAVLSSQGASLRDVVKFTTYLVDADDIVPFFEFRERTYPELFPDGSYPPNTLLVVERLVRPEFRIEVEAVAHHA
jgi:enamine deaminase RidA (YjgF/YER057c/UK114 family)